MRALLEQIEQQQDQGKQKQLSGKQQTPKQPLQETETLQERVDRYWRDHPQGHYWIPPPDWEPPLTEA